MQDPIPPIMLIFNKVILFYQDNLQSDLNRFVPAQSNHSLRDHFDELPQDYKAVLSLYETFRLGIYDFGIFGKNHCDHLGDYIVIAKAYYGHGSYATYNYYPNGNFIAKRIDDDVISTHSRCVFTSFSQLVSNYLAHIHKFDTKNGKVVAYFHSQMLN